MKYFRVKTGYAIDEFISITEEELQTAIRAQVTGKVAIFAGGTVSGNHIISIVPDYQRLMGWAPEHHLTGEDYREIGREKVDEYRVFLEGATREAREQLAAPAGIKRLN